MAVLGGCRHRILLEIESQMTVEQSAAIRRRGHTAGSEFTA